MARLQLALLLLFVAVSAVVVSAVDKPSTTTAEAPATMLTDPDEGVVDGPPDAIGTTDDDAPGTPEDDDVAVAGPVGSETSYANYPPPQQTPASGGSSVAIGFGSVVVAMAGSFFFF